MVLNPQAGRGRAGRLWPQVQAELNRQGRAWQLLPTESPELARSMLARLPADQPVLAVGGDGTASGLLPELARSGRGLGLVPLGSGNDFAGMLGLKAGDVTGALRRLDGPERAVDLISCELNGQERLLFNGMGMGFDAQVAELMRRAPARLGGFQRYLWAVLAGLRDLNSAPLTVTLDGQPLYQGRSCLAAVMNGTRYGGGFRISPGSDPADGLLNVVLGAGLGRAELLGVLLKVLRASHLRDRRVVAAQGREVTLRWASRMPAHLDGELAGELSEVRLRVKPGALRLLNAGSPQ
ncbi:diacylglycerol kinase family protein [Deinococcus sonorensis]|uniref:Diacylglycerol kinase family protein n=2 Tax=Deinococcus sonorensis TaxID=309891 RepID=A0AAU7UA18_9DEIO